MAQAPDTLSNDPLLGRTFAGQYTIERLIGRGGMGRVYLADQRTPPAKVVVKVLAPDWADDPEAVARFEREAERLSEISHSNIVELFDYGHEAGVSFIVMEFVDGELLSDYLTRRGPLAPDEAVPIMAQILKGTGYAHSRELMLRDIKPENVMLCSFKGRANFVKMLDFGLAKLVQEDANITKQNVLGTANYMAPEAIKGGQLDLRVDVYALGVLLYQMLAGKLPFGADTDTAVLYKHVNEPPPPLADVLPEGTNIPDGLLELIHDCLAKEVDDRPSDANAIVERLIDCVPLSMFRLPRADGSPTSGQSLTGKITGIHDPAKVVALSSSRPAMAAATGPVAANTGSITPSVAVDPLQDEIAAPSSKKGLVLLGAGIAAAAVIAMLTLGGGDDATNTADEAPGVQAAGIVDDDQSAVLAAVEQKLNDGQADEALAALDELDEDSLTGKDKSRATKLRTKIELQRLMGAAKLLEEKGETKAALATYREVIARDAANSDARAAISRLESASQEPAEAQDGKTGKLVVVSVPIASLYVDDKLVGQTPYSDRLELGSHTLRLEAEGYYERKGAVDVRKSGNEPLEFTLRRITDAGGQTSKKKSTKSSSKSGSTSTPPEPSAETKPKPEPKPEPESDSDVFMKTKKSKKKSIFLPVGD